MAAVPSFRLVFGDSKLTGRGGLSTCVSHLVTNTQRQLSWLAWPFAEQLLGDVMLTCIAPGLYGIWLLARHEWLFAAAVYGVWLPVYGFLLSLLHRQRVLRLAVSFTCTIALFAGV